jgi:hypothetical protein
LGIVMIADGSRQLMDRVSSMLRRVAGADPAGSPGGTEGVRKIAKRAQAPLERPGFALRVSPSSCAPSARATCWLNQIETWFSILQGQSLSGASFTAVSQLQEHMDAFISDLASIRARCSGLAVLSTGLTEAA